MSKDTVRRKARSEAHLEHEAVPINRRQRRWIAAPITLISRGRMLVK